MIKVLVVTYILAIHQAKYYIYDDYIVKQYFYLNDEVRNVTNISYAILDLTVDKVYFIPTDRNVRILQSNLQGAGEWTSGDSRILKTETTKVNYSGFKCLKEIEYSEINTPFGYDQSKKITYYANLGKYFKNYKPSTLYFLGFRNLRYDPYKYRIKQELENSETPIINIITVTIDYESVDSMMFSNILSYPIITTDPGSDK
jgi:hypothetical protein